MASAMATVFPFSRLVQVITTPSNFANSQLGVRSAFCRLEMKGVAAFALVLMKVHLCSPCRKVESVLICQKVLANFEPGCSTMAILMRNVGGINSSVLQSETLASITRLTGEDAGITQIAKNAFGSFPNLRLLHLDGNLLSQISPAWFRNPVVLRELRLAGNLIEGLNGSTLSGFTNLTTLSLRKNRIRSVHPSSFSSQSQLADLDLSENQLTGVSQQVFSSLGSLRFVRLDKNPWNCSCDAEDFINTIKELKRQNQLNESMGVTCESPPHLRGQPVWNVSVCPPTLTTSPAKPESSSPLKPSSKTETPFQSRPTDPPPTVSSHPVTPSSSSSSSSSSFSETCEETKPPDAPTPSSTENHVTSPPSDTKVRTLVVVIVVLSVLLLASCFMAGLQIRKRSKKAVMPECPKEEEEKKLEEEGRSSPDQSAGRSQIRYSEVTRMKSFCGVRAKSANAVILTSPFCPPKKDEAGIQTETEAPSDGSGRTELVIEREEILSDNFTATDSMSEWEKQENSDDLYKNPDCVYVNTETDPYLSIGTVQNNPGTDEESTAGPGPGERQQRGKVMRRVSTWPPSAAQWWARCKMMEEQEADSFAVWTQNVTLKLSDEVEETVNEIPVSDQNQKEEKTQVDLRFNTNRPSVNEMKTEERKNLDQVPLRQATTDVRCSEELKPGGNPAHESRGSSTSKADGRKEPKRSVTGRQRAESRAVASKAPSGGTSPDDETLLSGNEYVFVNLLHEVAQNNGRWTRERWKQTHINKQRR